MGNISRSHPLRSLWQEEKRKEEWEGDWDKEKAASDRYESATVDPAGDLVGCQNAKSGGIGGRTPGTPRDGKRPLDGSISQREEKTTWKVKGNCDEEWKGEHSEKEKVKITRERKHKTLQENSQRRDLRTFLKKKQAGKGPKRL